VPQSFQPPVNVYTRKEQPLTRSPAAWRGCARSPGTSGPLKPAFGLSGDVHTSQTRANEQTRLSSCHGGKSAGGGWPTQARFWLEWGCSHVTALGPANKLDCPHAMGTHAFSPQRAESFRHILLLQPPHSTPSLRSVSRSGQAPLAYHRRKPPNLRVSLGTSAAQLQTLRLWLCSHARACSPPARANRNGTRVATSPQFPVGEMACLVKLSQRESKLLDSGRHSAVTAVIDKLHARS